MEEQENTTEGLIDRIINPLDMRGFLWQRPTAAPSPPHSSTTQYPQHTPIQQQPAFRMQDAEPMNEGREYNEIQGSCSRRCRDDPCHAPRNEHLCL